MCGWKHDDSTSRLIGCYTVPPLRLDNAYSVCLLVSRCTHHHPREVFLLFVGLDSRVGRIGHKVFVLLIFTYRVSFHRAAFYLEATAHGQMLVEFLFDALERERSVK